MTGWQGAILTLAIDLAILQVAGWAVAGLALLAEVTVFIATASVALAEKD